MIILPESSPVERLALLEKQVGALQEQLAQLALQLLQERLRLQTGLQQHIEIAPKISSSPPFLASSAPNHQIHPAELRARQRVLPRIEYKAQKGLYIIVCPQDGELSIIPDSPEWFEWLASVKNFQFIGKRGHFTAYRETKHGQRTRTWMAYRRIQKNNYRHYLGITDRLTITAMEKAAAQLQSHLTT